MQEPVVKCHRCAKGLLNDRDLKNHLYRRHQEGAKPQSGKGETLTEDHIRRALEHIQGANQPFVIEFHQHQLMDFAIARAEIYSTPYSYWPRRSWWRRWFS